jgi:hypothetical protein
MKYTWSLRDELAEASKKWYSVLMFILIGALIGAGTAWLNPGPYEASSDFYVGLDVYRYFRDLNIPIQPEGVNDYKNWQMEDLKLVMTSGKTLNESLKLLRLEDPYWNTVEPDELASMINIYWRNAGRWRLGAKDANKEYALQAVQAWERAALKEVKTGVEQSQQVMVLDARIQALAARQADLETRQAQVNTARSALDDWLINAGKLSDEEMISNELLSELFALIQTAQLDDLELSFWNSGRSQSTSEIPISGSTESDLSKLVRTVASVKAWAYQARTRLQVELVNLAAQEEQLEKEMTRLTELYGSASKNSWGLSANLIVRSLTDEPPTVRQLRPFSQMILVGAIAGLLFWLIYWMIGISRKNS